MNYVEIVRAELSRLHVPRWQYEDIESAGFEAAAKALTRTDLRNPGAFIRVAARRAMQKEKRRLDRINDNEQASSSVTLYGDYVSPKEMFMAMDRSGIQMCVERDEQMDRNWRML